MEEQPQQQPRGRGAALIDALKRAQQDRPGGDVASATTTTESPKPRGRAALLQKVAQMKESRAGSQTTTKSVTALTESMAASTVAGPLTYPGTSGTHVKISANYIRLSMEQDRGVFEYDIRYNPNIDSKSMRIKILNSHLPKMGNIKMFDGGSCLYLPIKLPNTKTVFTGPHPNEDTVEIELTVVYKKEKRLGECLHLYNVLFKRIMHVLLFSRVGRNYFDPKHTHMIPQHKLEVLPGYAVAVDEYEGGVMVCLDTQHRVLRTQSVLDVLIELRLLCKERFKEAAYKALIGASVLTRYNNKTYKVDDIVWDSCPESTFATHSGDTISYMEYYKKQYDLNISDTKQPLLLNVQSRSVAGQAEKTDTYVCLIPELCYMTGLTDEMRADFRVMKDVAQYTRVTPNQRAHALRTFLDNVKKTPQAQTILGDWGLKIVEGSIDLQARVINPETIIFGNGEGQFENADWNTALSRNKVVGPVDLVRWAVMYTSRDESKVREFGDNMVRLGSVMGYRVAKPIFKMVANDRTDCWVTEIRNIINPEIQILVFVCPTSRDDRYSAIKKVCCAQMPIPTQVINSRTLGNAAKVRSITQKIALQMNCKVGGSLWTLSLPFKNWMIIGIDVYHSPGSSKPVCGFVASINQSLTRWFSLAIFQEKELGDHLKWATAKALEKYRATNGVLPTNIIIFRDGVGDGQLSHCQQYEVAQFEDCLKQYDLENIKLCMVVVQKRINTRLFLQKSNGMDNPPPGTILDHTVTRRNWYDFFLVSQNVRQGTASPTHYIVLQDRCNLKPDHVQRLAYKLCHLYYNWAGTIRVPAPCQYAHKLAYLIGQHVRKEPSPLLNDRLYYL